MSTPMETNTEELREILNEVYNLPNRSTGGSSEPDLVLRVDTPYDTNVNSYEFTEDNFTIVSGNLQNIKEKLLNYQPVEVVANMDVYYWDVEYRGVMKAEVHGSENLLYVTFNFWGLRLFAIININDGSFNNCGSYEI